MRVEVRVPRVYTQNASHNTHHAHAHIHRARSFSLRLLTNVMSTPITHTPNKHMSTHMNTKMHRRSTRDTSARARAHVNLTFARRVNWSQSDANGKASDAYQEGTPPRPSDPSCRPVWTWTAWSHHPQCPIHRHPLPQTPSSSTATALWTPCPRLTAPTRATTLIQTQAAMQCALVYSCHNMATKGGGWGKRKCRSCRTIHTA